ncbi:MAG: sigma-70 domain-containing protein [Eubacteriales bacterium]|nr:sigma-70 domain-containing protein [Eubacteriales bacterium]
MEDQNKFLEILEDVKGIAKAQNNRLTQQEIKDYLSDMALSEEQWKAVYQYLGANHIHVEGYAYIPQETSGEETSSDQDRELGRAEKNRSLYQMELRQLPPDRKEILLYEIGQFLRGENQYRDRIIESRLHQVVEIAQRYTKYAVPVEELIAEGNLGLLNGMMLVEADRERFLLEEGSVNIQAFLELLEQEVIRGMEQFIDQETESRDQESTMLAKTNLLHEAAKYMTEEIGRVPTIEELSEYTKISREEIHQIMGLSEDAKRVASPGNFGME